MSANMTVRSPFFQSVCHNYKIYVETTNITPYAIHMQEVSVLVSLTESVDKKV